MPSSCSDWTVSRSSGSSDGTSRYWTAKNPLPRSSMIRARRPVARTVTTSPACIPASCLGSAHIAREGRRQSTHVRPDPLPAYTRRPELTLRLRDGDLVVRLLRLLHHVVGDFDALVSGGPGVYRQQPLRRLLNRDIGHRLAGQEHRRHLAALVADLLVVDPERRRRAARRRRRV